MRSRPGVVMTVLTAVALALAGCSSPEPAPDVRDDVAGGDYSVTQNIQNNSPLDLAVQSVTADNNGVVVPGWPTVIRAGTPGSFKATNVGNGVQMKVTLVGVGGQDLLVDSDVPRTEGNWSTATLTGTRSGLSTGKIAIGSGDNPTADFTIDPCPEDSKTCVTESSTDPGPPVAKPSG